jgi:hypothetical protein
MKSIDEEYLINALNNDNNESIIKLTSQKIKTAKNDILQKLQLPKNKLKEFHNKLKEYRYVDEIKDINYGCFLRWINLKNIDDVKLTNGGYLCDIQINDTGVGIICKNIFNRHFYINMNEILLFQKLTDQEKILLSVMDHLNK